MTRTQKEEGNTIPALRYLIPLAVLFCLLLINGCASVDSVQENPFASLPVPELPGVETDTEELAKKRKPEPPRALTQEEQITVSESEGGDTIFSIPGLDEHDIGFPQHRPALPLPDSLSSAFDAPVSDIIAAYLQSMTIEEKIGQLFILEFGSVGRADVTSITEPVRSLIETFSPGGFILFARNLSTIPETSRFIRDLQDASEIPLFIATDQEGGIVSRLTETEVLNATHIPSERIIGKTGDPKYARLAAEVSAKELYALGVNMNFAPVADIVLDIEESVIGNRAYGANPDLAADMVAAAVQGMQSHGVSSVVKHFPGHGRVYEDTHTGTAALDVSADELMELELVPFYRAAEAGCDGIMTAHITLPKVLDTTTPATFSTFALTDVLRGLMKYDGLVITDSLNMGAINRYWEPEEAAVNALAAGADILLMPSDYTRAFEGVRAALIDGRLTEDRIDASVQRILRTKLARGILQGDYRGLDIDPESIIGSQEHRDAINEIIEAAKTNSQ